MNDYPGLPLYSVSLLIGGTAYIGWTEISIDRGIDSLVGSFELALTAKDKADAPDFPIAAGDACTVVLDGKALITGWIDKVDRQLDSEARTISVSGRDKAADLVDCAAINKPGSWSNATLDTIARELAQPFGVAVSVTGDPGKPFAKFALQQGETAFSAIERMARYRGLILFSDGKGGIVIGNPDSGKRAGRVAEGENLLSIDKSDDASQRFSDYIVKGQASGSDTRHGAAVAQIRGEAKDAGVTRYRPMMVIGEEQSDAASLAQRAAWEAKVRAARGERSTATVPGWWAGSGETAAVWEPGARADCSAPSVKLAGDRLIERVRLTRGQDGTRTELTLVPPDAWAQLAEPEGKAA